MSLVSVKLCQVVMWRLLEPIPQICKPPNRMPAWLQNQHQDRTLTVSVIGGSS